MYAPSSAPGKGDSREKSNSGGEVKSTDVGRERVKVNHKE
jgi:hypothetical protein